MEILSNLESERPKLKVTLFDFDGTISTLRCGWEDIMEPLMLEIISGSRTVAAEKIEKRHREIFGG